MLELTVRLAGRLLLPCAMLLASAAEVVDGSNSQVSKAPERDRWVGGYMAASIADGGI